MQRVQTGHCNGPGICYNDNTIDNTDTAHSCMNIGPTYNFNERWARAYCGSLPWRKTAVIIWVILRKDITLDKHNVVTVQHTCIMHAFRGTPQFFVYTNKVWGYQTFIINILSNVSLKIL